MGTYSEIRRLDAYVDSHVLNGTDWSAVTQNARARQSREMARMVRALIAWIGRAVVSAGHAVLAWQRQSGLKRTLSEMPDHLLRDIGVRRDQIPALAAGSLRRQPSVLERAVADPTLSFIRTGVRPVERDPANPASPMAA